MYKGTIAAGTAATANTNLAFDTAYNTNGKVRFLETEGRNVLQFGDAGWFDVEAQVVITGVVGDITLQMYADGVAVPEAVASETAAAATDLVTLHIADVRRIMYSPEFRYANISFQLSAAATINAGSLIVEKRV